MTKPPVLTQDDLDQLVNRLYPDLQPEPEPAEDDDEITMEQLLLDYDRVAGEIQALNDEMAFIRSEIQERLDVGDVVEGAGYRVQYLAGSERVKWDTKALEGFAAAYPELLKLRSTYETKPSLRFTRLTK